MLAKTRCEALSVECAVTLRLIGDQQLIRILAASHMGHYR